jgi:hypothetical protein
MSRYLRNVVVQKLVEAWASEVFIGARGWHRKKYLDSHTDPTTAGVRRGRREGGFGVDNVQVLLADFDPLATNIAAS